MSSPLFPDNIWAFANPEEESTEEILELDILSFELEYINSNWMITSPEEPDFKEFATKLAFDVPVRIEDNKLFCEALFFIGPDNTAYFVTTSPETAL